MREYVDNNGYNDAFQSAYRPHHSTETALVRIHNDMMQSMDCRRRVLLDLSAAFDTLDHDILLKRLHDIGVRHTVLELVQMSTNVKHDQPGFLVCLPFFLQFLLHFTLYFQNPVDATLAPLSNFRYSRWPPANGRRLSTIQIKIILLLYYIKMQFLSLRIC